MGISIKVNVGDLLEKITSMVEEGYNTVELEIEDSVIEEDASLYLMAIDPVTGDNPEYGSIPYDDGEL